MYPWMKYIYQCSNSIIQLSFKTTLGVIIIVIMNMSLLYRSIQTSAQICNMDDKKPLIMNEYHESICNLSSKII